MTLKSIDKTSFPQGAIPIILACYLAPVLLYTRWSLAKIDASWSTWSVGLVLTLFGTCFLFLTMRSRTEPSIPCLTSPATEEPSEDPKKITPLHGDTSEDYTALETAFSHSQQHNEELAEELKNTLHQLRELEQSNKQLNEELERTQQEFDAYRSSVATRLEEGDQTALGLQKTVAEQRDELERKQHLVSMLENKVHDLSYEVKTLLQLGDITSAKERDNLNEKQENLHPALDALNAEDHAIEVDTLYDAPPASSHADMHSSYNASIQLDQCIRLAEEMEGAAHLKQGAGLNDLGDGNLALNLRKLSDIFRSEVSAPALVINPAEGSFLLASDQVQGLLGWAPEKITTEFAALVLDGQREWQEALAKVASERSASVRLVLKAKSGENVMVHVHLATINVGIFRNCVVAILQRKV